MAISVPPREQPCKTLVLDSCRYEAVGVWKKQRSQIDTEVAMLMGVFSSFVCLEMGVGKR